jgi:MYXO-CTERM domain-containing protein
LVAGRQTNRLQRLCQPPLEGRRLRAKRRRRGPRIPRLRQQPALEQGWFQDRVDGSDFKILHSFGGPGDGAQPTGGLTWDGGGNIYGTTLSGGINGAGTVFVLSVPEPNSFALAGLALLALFAVARRRG